MSQWRIIRERISAEANVRPLGRLILAASAKSKSANERYFTSNMEHHYYSFGENMGVSHKQMRWLCDIAGWPAPKEPAEVAAEAVERLMSKWR
jgi:hypothetical protein